MPSGFDRPCVDAGLRDPIAHDSYLINLAAPEDELWRKSIDAFVDELQRAELLGLAYVVTHPGAYTTSSEEAGLARIVTALDEVHGQTRGLKARALLETTAGQGTALGWRFEHLATILAGVQDPERLGICVDTCHVFAAGYPLADEKDYQATFDALDKIVGLGQIKAFHLNDSQKEIGSRMDRHAPHRPGEAGPGAVPPLVERRALRPHADVPGNAQRERRRRRSGRQEPGHAAQPRPAVSGRAAWIARLYTSRQR